MSTRWPSLFFISKGTKIPGPKVTCLKSHNQLTVELELVLRSFLGGGEVLPQVCYWHRHALLFTTNLIPDHNWETEARSPLVHDGNLPVWTGVLKGRHGAPGLWEEGTLFPPWTPVDHSRTRVSLINSKCLKTFPRFFFFFFFFFFFLQLVEMGD